MVSSNASLPSLSACECNETISPQLYYSNVAAVAFGVPTALFAVVSNGVVIATVAKTRSLQRPANILLSSLALGDLLVGAVVQPIWTVLSLVKNTGNCCRYNNAIRMAFRIIPFFALNSFVQICVMSWDRYKAVSSPIVYRSTVSKKKTLAVAAMAWLVWVIVFSSLQFGATFVRRVVGSLFGGSILAIIAVTHVGTIRAIRRRKTEIANINASEERNAFAKEKKMAVTLRWILALTVLSMCPQIVLNVFHNVVNTGNWEAMAYLFRWARLIMCLNSSLSPIVYFWRHKKMRSAAVQMLTCTE